MKKTLASLVLGTSAMFNGCSSAPELTNENFIYESKAGIVSNNDGTYSIPTVSLTGKGRLVPQKSTKPLVGELPIIFAPYQEGSWIVKDRDNKSIDLETDKILIAKPHYSGEENSRKLTTEVHFNNEGPYALSAKINRRNLSAIRDFTHKDITYKIPTLFIDSDANPETPQEEFYVPIILSEDKKSVRETLMVPVRGTKELIDPVNGKIIIRTNPGNIYVLTEISTQDYNSRVSPVSQEKTPEIKEEEKSSGAVTVPK